MKDEPFTPQRETFFTNQMEDRRFWLLGFPALLYLWGLARRDPQDIDLALLTLVVAFPVWCAWTLWRVTGRFPAEDSWRAVAVLVYGGAAWLALPFFLLMGANLGLAVFFPLLLAAYCWAFIVAYRPRVQMAPRPRAWLLAGAAVICGLWIAVLVTADAIILRNPDSHAIGMDLDRLFVGLTALLIPLAAFLAVRLTRSALKGFVLPPPITAESLLAD